MTSQATQRLITHVDDRDWNYLADNPGDKDIRWKTLTGGPGCATQSVTFGICEVPPGGRLRPHGHAEDEVYYVTAGTAEVLLDQEIVPLRPGSVLFVPGDLSHGVRNKGTETLSLIWIFAADRWTDIEYYGVEREF